MSYYIYLYPGSMISTEADVSHIEKCREMRWIWHKASELTQCVKVLIVNIDYLSSRPKSHMMEQRNQLLILCLLRHTLRCFFPTSTYINKCNCFKEHGAKYVRQWTEPELWLSNQVSLEAALLRTQIPLLKSQTLTDCAIFYHIHVHHCKQTQIFCQRPAGKCWLKSMLCRR